MIQPAHESSVDILQAEYNAIPYHSYPFSHTHPTHLFTLATLFGLQPKAVEKARILELGCASGGNIIPLAMHFPNAECVGIDLAEKQIEEGLKQIEALNIRNINLRHQSIFDFSSKEGKFDYIICHGVYSWVDKNVREKILTICTENLNKNGIAYISYNTYPGWNMVNSVRELMSWHTKNISEPALKAQHARSVLKFITDGLQEDQSPYASFLRGEINLLSTQSDNYLLHDHLSSFNQPIYFHQFMEQANAHKLSYLSDAFLATMYTGNLPAQFATELNKINNIIVIGQYMDFIRNQRFRCTLLCHQDVQVNRSLKTNNIEHFYLQLLAKPSKADLNEKDLIDGKEINFVHGAITLTVRNRISQIAMLILHQERFKPIHYNDLCKKVAKMSKTTDLEVVKKHLNDDLNLLRAVFAGLINISSYPGRYTLVVAEKPIACPLTRYQAAIQNYVTNRRHEPIALDPMTKSILPYMDGTHDKDALLKIARELVDKGSLLVLDENKNQIKDKKELDKRMPLFYQNALDNIAKQGLLIEKE
ncbi:MAG: methyltransferase regulatory domain-containing protein [Gammaproteobacteria bacterium]|jgi:methyltransferase-like protein/2-polyprenyl-3-methyl-5-hydroxy-6-metoxy-1,4-benzoquinol methylase|nr:methyltransferase regulatory domain-containing protein [Gammaproteobacteria bacterium]